MANEKISPKDANLYIISYNTLRKAIGILGISFPFILAIGYIILNGQLQLLNSFSSYAHTRIGNGLVGIICAIALFLFSYLGYDRRDNILGHLGALFALGLAFFPNNTAHPWTTINILHLSSALCFFVVLILFSLWLFPKTDKKVMSQQKKNRNRVYKICGYTMIISLASIVLYMIFLDGIFPEHGLFKPVFWLETFALIAFGISWITKAQVIYKDKEE